MRVAPVLLLLAGCGGANLVLKSPIEDRCTEAGLSGCPDLAEGITMYIDGDKAEARRKVIRAAAANSPGQIKKFAAALKTLGEVPGASEYIGPVLEIANLLVDDAAKYAPPTEEPARTARKGAGRDKDESDEEPRKDHVSRSERAVAADLGAMRGLTKLLTADTDPTRLERGAASPAGATGKFLCGADTSSVTYCVRAIAGPVVVTDLAVAEGCSNESFAAAGPSDAALGVVSWWVPARTSVHGSRLLVRKGETLFLGARAASVAKLQADARCLISWSGFRPYDAAE